MQATLWECRATIDPLTGGFELLPTHDVPPAALLALASEPSRAQIERLEGFMAQHDQVEMPPVHRYAEGLYAREITIPAGTLMTGRVHLFEHVSIMLRGDMTVLTEQGMERVQGPKVFISPAGTKRVGYAHEETVWVTVHTNPDDDTDVERIEARLAEPSSLSRLRQSAWEELWQ